MVKISLFNHKGGVGKTTRTINLADALADMGHRVLVVDADPQCNISSFYLPEDRLDQLLGESNDVDLGNTVWSAIQPVVDGRGPVRDVNPIRVANGANVFLAPGDVLLADYEEVLPAAWTDSFARRTRGYDVVCALSLAVERLAAATQADFVFYDVGPNVGPLNRVILLDSDFFITPVCADLFSLRALITVGRSVARWVSDWRTVRQLATEPERQRLLAGEPKYLGYVAFAFKVYAGREKAKAHKDWESMTEPRVSRRVVDTLRAVSPELVRDLPRNKVGDVKHFHSLAPAAQQYGLAIGKLRGYVNPGHYVQVDEARSEFETLARELERRVSQA